MSLGIYTAVLGGEIIINTLDGKVKLDVKPENQNGTKVRLRGNCFPVYKNEGHFVDLIITYIIKIPTGLTEKQKALFTELSMLLDLGTDGFSRRSNYSIRSRRPSA